MFGIGMPELAVILVVALIVLGPKRLPEVARQIGKAMGEFRRQSNELMEDFTSAQREEEEAARRKQRDDRRAAQQAAAKPAVAAAKDDTPPKDDPTSGAA